MLNPSGSAKLSVITLVYRRDKQLGNLADSLYQSYLELAPEARPEVQFVIVDMECDHATPIYIEDSKFKIDQYNIHEYFDTTTATLPLAAARNLGGQKASAPYYAFVDVDCLVEPYFFAKFLQFSRSQESTKICMGYPEYLPYIPLDGCYSNYADSAVVHPGRAALKDRKLIEWKSFWSLCFFISAENFELIRGFDEGFTGYGAEDTDFAKRANASGIEFTMQGPRVLHQYHTKIDPPLNYLDDIVANSNYYHKKWQQYPMMKWLDSMRNSGYINKDFEEEGIRVIKHPKAADLASHLSLNPY